MKSVTSMFFTCCLFILMSACLSVFGQMMLSTSVRYAIGIDDGSPETTGYELTLPLGLAYRGENFSISAETAYSNAYVEDTDDAEASITSFTDTLVSASYNYVFPKFHIEHPTIRYFLYLCLYLYNLLYQNGYKTQSSDTYDYLS